MMLYSLTTRRSASRPCAGSAPDRGEISVETPHICLEAIPVLVCFLPALLVILPQSVITEQETYSSRRPDSFLVGVVQTPLGHSY